MNTKSLAAGALALLLGFSLVHCGDDPPDQTPNGGTDVCDPDTDPTCPQCDLDEDCGDPAHFICDSSTQRCVPACTTRAQCSAHPAANGGALPGCDGVLGCQCDERRCVAQACTSDTECGDLVCKSGQCVAPDTADGCRIFPDVALLRQGEDVRFSVVAYNGDKPAVVGSQAFEWSAAGPSVTAKGDGVFTGASANSTFESHVKATLKGNGDVSCLARVQVFGAPAAGEIRVIVVDEMTGRLVRGAKVIVDNGGTRTELADTAAPGVHLGTAPTAGANTVSVFHEDYGYVTLVDMPVENTDLYIPVRRNSGDKVGGFKGKFTNLTKTDVHIGLAGTSIPGSLTDLDLNVLVGPTQDTSITFSGQTFNVPLPSGVVLGLGTTLFKGEYQALGVAGVCGDEDSVLEGTCGTRSAWSLMGDVKLADLPISELTSASGGIENLNIGGLLAKLLPKFRTFKSGVVRDVEFATREPPSGGVTELFADDDVFAPTDMTPTVGLTLRSTVEVPDLPTAGGNRLDSAVVLAGALVNGRGVLPLGLTAGLDTNDKFPNANGKVIGEEDNDDGKLTLRMAPNHSGIEGSRYAVAALAVSINGFTTGERLAMSGLVKLEDKLPYGSQVKFEDGFLGFSDGGGYDYRNGIYTGAKLVPEASLHRVVFKDSRGRAWSIYFKGANFTVPTTPTGFGDRTLFNSPTSRQSSSATRSPYMIQALAAKDASGAVDMVKLFTFNGSNADNLVEFTTAFSVYDFDRPLVAFSEPNNNDTVKGTHTFKVKVSNFSVPAQGKVKFTATKQGGGTEQEVFVDSLTDGEASAAFSPALDAGTWTIKAELTNPANVPLNPAVATQIQVTVQ